MSAATGTDWTRIFSEPDLVRHVGKLLQAYREAPADKREQRYWRHARDQGRRRFGNGKSAPAGTVAPPVPTPAVCYSSV